MTEYLNVPGGRIAYSVTGEGPLVVLAPGLGDLRAAYRFVVPELADAGYRVATMDLRGVGESSTGWDAHTTTAVGTDYVALIRHLGGGPATVVGQSFTCDSAVYAAAELPSDVTGVVTIAGWAAPPRLSPLLALASRLVLRSPALWARFYTWLYNGPRPPDFADYVKALRTNLREPGRTADLAAMGTPKTMNSASYRAAVRQPTLVLMGSRDREFPDPRAEAEAYTADFAGPTEVVMIEGAGHYPHAQFPTETSAAIRTFLDRTAHG